jgi:glutamine amidotransferase
MNLALYDYGAGNLHSLKKALEAGGAGVTVTTDWDLALDRDGVVLPGVGSFGAAVRSLDGNRKRIRERLGAGYPCLGICLGMQLFLDESEEGEGKGLGFVSGVVRALEGRVVPQMGWNDVELGGDPLFSDLDNFVAYYANSFICEPEDSEAVIARTEYEGRTFAAALRKERTWGVQFHPEKSSSPGLHLIKNFLEAVR